jgi:hypothetical protein
MLRISASECHPVVVANFLPRELLRLWHFEAPLLVSSSEHSSDPDRLGQKAQTTVKTSPVRAF